LRDSGNRIILSAHKRKGMKNFNLIVIFMVLAVFSQAQITDLAQVATGFNRPLDITHAGDDRLFVVERGGKIRIMELNGTILPEPYLDIDPIVFDASNQDERGLLGMAFHPDYQSNGYFYVNYIDNDGNTNIVRYEVDGNNPNLANPNSAETILIIEQPVWNHNGGCLKFGLDGYLYIGMGDGGAGNDPSNYAQNRLSLLGKMLRIDVDNGLPYTIPADNPFAMDDFTLDEIWAIGLRNPWRFSFDRETGDLWIGDVGQSAIEEIDFQPATSTGGENYGWRCYEGTEFTFNSAMNECQKNYTEPVYEIQHSGFTGPCSVTGGYVYRGTQYSELMGKYICADYCTGDFYVVESDGQGGWSGSEVASFPYDISTFGEDVNGELYVAAFSSGRILRIVGENIVNTTEIPLLESFEIHPNPTNGSARIELTTKTSLEIEIQLVDMQGRLVLSRVVEVNGTHREELNFADLSTGTYIVNLVSGKRLLSKQLVVN